MVDLKDTFNRIFDVREMMLEARFLTLSPEEKTELIEIKKLKALKKISEREE